MVEIYCVTLKSLQTRSSQANPWNEAPGCTLTEWFICSGKEAVSSLRLAITLMTKLVLSAQGTFKAGMRLHFFFLEWFYFCKVASSVTLNKQN